MCIYIYAHTYTNTHICLSLTCMYTRTHIWNDTSTTHLDLPKPPKEVQAVHPPNRSIWPFRKEGRRHQLRSSLSIGTSFFLWRFFWRVTVFGRRRPEKLEWVLTFWGHVLSYKQSFIGTENQLFSVAYILHRQWALYAPENVNPL